MGREYFGDTREPFALTLGGEKLYFLTNPDHVNELYKNTTSFAFDKIVHELSLTFQVSNATMTKVFHRPSSDEEDIVSRTLQIKNPRRKSLAELNNDFWKQQLVPGPLYYDLQRTFLRYIQINLNRDKILSAYRASTGSTKSKPVMEVSLMSLCQGVLIDAALRAFLGDRILELEPTLVEDFIEFDCDNWKLWYKWPNSTKMFAAKNRLANSLQRWLALPEADRPGRSFIAEIFEKTQRALETPNEDLANILCLLIFVSVLLFSFVIRYLWKKLTHLVAARIQIRTKCVSGSLHT